jgi:hypothetical protein
MADNDLYYRRQFVLMHDTCASFNHWQYLNVGDFHLYAHPDIELSTVTSADMDITVVLVGYIIDPHNPEQSNTDALSIISKFANSFERIVNYLHSLSGRFVLIIKTPEETWLFHDPCGLRTVYYTQYKGKLYVGSQPNIFKHVIPLEDGERLSSYLKSEYVKKEKEHWIPSGCSLYEEVYHLIPNHALRFSTLEQIRYWPKGIISQKSVDEVVMEASGLLSKLMLAANKRFKLALPLTAGWDSRALLSASKSISNEVYFYTLQYRFLNARSSDIRIPRKLLRSLGLPHNVIDCRKIVPEEFSEIYQQNTTPAHMDDWGKIAYGMFDTYPQERVCLKGNCSEIVRCFYYESGTHEEIKSPGQIIALERGWNTIPFINDQISTWFNEACEASAQANKDILDLFYWEHRMGSWQAQGQLEWDIVQEAFTPFNHRGLIETILTVPTKFRCAPNYLFYQIMMEVLWPEVMSQPVNPKTAIMLLKNGLRYLGVYEIIKKVYKQTFLNKT